MNLFLSIKSSSFSGWKGNHHRRFITLLGFSCVIPGRNMIKQSAKAAALQRSRLSCFSWSSHRDVHSSFDCVWNHVSAQCSSDTGLIGTGEKNVNTLQQKQTRRAENIFRRLFCRNKIGDSPCLDFSVSSSFSLRSPNDSIWTKKRKKYLSDLIFLCTQADSGLISVQKTHMHICKYVCVCTFFFYFWSCPLLAVRGLHRKIN